MTDLIEAIDKANQEGVDWICACVPDLSAWAWPKAQLLRALGPARVAPLR